MSYTKTHKSPKAAASHTKKIKKRGGKVKRSEVSFGSKLTYFFQSKKKKKKKKK